MIPKFRAWDKHIKKMRAVTDIHFDYDLFYLKAKKGKGYYCNSIDINLMQSTGLKGYLSDEYEDTEEKDVFKGDVIDIFWEEWPMGYYQENHMIGVVDKDETGTAWIIKNAKYDFDTPKPIPSEIDGISVSMSLPDAEDLEEIFLHNFNLTADDITILGNIYENPELLEVQNETKSEDN